MDRTKQKAKKEKPNKYVEKEKSPSFIADVKTIKENLKIREILRTVKMNSSMRIKAPRGSKVMQNKDFNDNEDFDETSSDVGQDLSEPPSATNTLVVNNNSDINSTTEDDCISKNESSQEYLDENDGIVRTDIETGVIHKSKSLCEGLEETGRERVSTPDSLVPSIVLPPLESPPLRIRDRKLSLDHTMLSKREGLSQSEVDLHSIGKSPLERKSSFFRKKMDSFLKNTTEIFKRQSLGSKSSQSEQRRGSASFRMSVSMQSLNENEAYNGEYDGEALDKYNEELRGSVTSLRSSATVARSNSSLSVGQSDRVPPDQSEDDSLAGSRPGLNGSQPLKDNPATSNNSLNESYNQESFLHSRAISMSSGLDTAHRPRNRKTSRSNRVTWVASESLTDYFRRLIQDEKKDEIQVSHSYQDFSAIPENNPYGSPKTDSKGRRLSYQRAVSGEDPVLPTKYQDSSLRRRKIAESSEGSNEISKCLATFTRSGVPPLVGFQIRSVPDDALAYLLWAEGEENLKEYYDSKNLSPVEEARQAAIKELIQTEADYIRHLMNIVEVYLAAAHALQDVNQLLDLDTKKLFLNIPDVLNANMKFWELVIYPMITESFKNNTTFDTDLMGPGFAEFSEIFDPYEDYVCHQSKAVDYLRALTTNTDFMTYLTWCHNKNPSNRLQLADILVKPMQRLTKYSIIIRRIITYTESEQSKSVLEKMDATAISFVHRVNRAMRQREELEKLDDLDRVLDGYEVDFKDEDLDRCFRLFNAVNIKAPMHGCGSLSKRAIIYEGDLRYKDHLKEMDVRVILLTDMILICKKPSKGLFQYKMIRPKIFLKRTVSFFGTPKKEILPSEITNLIYVILDEQGSSVSAFHLCETAKDPNPQQTLKIWEQKIREAKMTYYLTRWFYANPVKDLSEIETDYTTEIFKRDYPDDWITERRARQRVAAMMHSNKRVSVHQKVAKTSKKTSEPGRGPPDLHNPLRLHGVSLEEKSPLASRYSSFQNSMSFGATWHDEPPYGFKYVLKAGTIVCSSVEHLIPSQNLNDVARSITVNVVNYQDNRTVTSSAQSSPPLLVLHRASPFHTPSPRSASAEGSQNTLQAPPNPVTAVYSLPDLNVQYNFRVPPSPPPIQPSASEKLYQSHQELLQRNKLAASQHQLLTPDHRGTSYPPPSPTRRSLIRGVAFSNPVKYPPLLKMGNVFSQSQGHLDEVLPSTSQAKVPVVSQISSQHVASKSADKGDKKKSSGRSKSGAKASSTDQSKNEKSFSSDELSTHEDDNKPKSKGKSDKHNAKVKGNRPTRRDKE